MAINAIDFVACCGIDRPQIHVMQGGDPVHLQAMVLKTHPIAESFGKGDERRPPMILRKISISMIDFLVY